MKQPFLRIHPKDNILVALKDLPTGAVINIDTDTIQLAENIPAKHKFVIEPLDIADPIFMYGVLVGKASKPIKKGGRITIENTVHGPRGC